jgi:oxygen-independent coproporphyrinogen-3 oxidase
MTFHERTPYERYRQLGRISAQPDEVALAMTQQIEEAMERAALERYEVSNFARPSKRSRHNSGYWTGYPFLGVGPGAHSFLRHDWQRGFRWEGIRRPERYIKAMQNLEGRALPFDQPDAVSFIDLLTHKQLLSERIMTAMRMPDGISLGDLDLGECADDVHAARQEAIERGWLEDSSERLVPTVVGLRYADSLAELFF